VSVHSAGTPHQCCCAARKRSISVRAAASSRRSVVYYRAKFIVDFCQQLVLQRGVVFCAVLHEDFIAGGTSGSALVRE